MPDYKDILKRGWHPEKDGTTIKDQVAGVFSRNKTSTAPRNSTHPAPSNKASIPDVSQFAPPPRRTAGTPTATSAEGTRPPPPPPPPPTAGTTSATAPPALPPRLPPRQTSAPSLSGVALKSHAAPPLPHRAPSSSSTSVVNTPAVSGGTATIATHVNDLQQRFSKLAPTAASALRKVQHPAAAAAAISTSSSSSGGGGGGGVKGTSQLPPPPQPGAASAGSVVPGSTSWTEKQTALRTASQLHKDPSSVTVSDTRAAFGTANSFRQKHGETINSGMRTVGKVNEKYGIADKLARFGGAGVAAAAPRSNTPQTSTAQGQHHVTQQSNSHVAQGTAIPVMSLAGKKPPPPPPPPKRANFPASTSAQAEGPPPVPMATRPS